MTQELRDPGRSTMAALYMLGGIAAALAAVIFILSFRSTVA
jgi:hypothetical protein